MKANKNVKFHVTHITGATFADYVVSQ